MFVMSVVLLFDKSWNLVKLTSLQRYKLIRKLVNVLIILR